MQEDFYRLSILVEQDLYKRIRAIKEGSFQNEKEIIKETIYSFERNLPESLKKLSNLHEFILNKIKEIDEEMRKLRESNRNFSKEER